MILGRQSYHIASGNDQFYKATAKSYGLFVIDLIQDTPDHHSL